MDAFLFQAGRMLGGRWADEAEAAQDAHLATLSGRKNATVGMDGGSDQPPPDTAAETDAVDVDPSVNASQAAARVSIDEQRVERVRQAAKAAGIQLKVSPEEVAATHSAAAAASGDVETTMTCARLLIRISRFPRWHTLVAVAVAPRRRIAAQGLAFSEGGAATPRRTRAVTDTNKGSTTGDASSTIEETDKEAIRRKRIASLDQSATSHEKFVGRGEGNRDDPVDVD